MADFDSRELDTIEDRLEGLEQFSSAELEELALSPKVTARLAQYGEILRDAEQALEPVEPEPSTTHAILAAARESCEVVAVQSLGADMAASDSTADEGSERRSKRGWWVGLFVAAAGATAAVTFMVPSAGDQPRASTQASRVAARAAPSTSLLPQKDAVLLPEPGASELLAVAPEADQAEPQSAQPFDAEQRVAPLYQDEHSADGEQAKLAPTEKAKRSAARPPLEAARDFGSTAATDDLAGAGGSVGIERKGASKQRKRRESVNAKPARPSQSNRAGEKSKKTDESLSRPRSAYRSAEAARARGLCDRAKRGYRRVLAATDTDNSAAGRILRARAEIGLGLCASAANQSKAADAHFARARGLWTGADQDIKSKRGEAKATGRRSRKAAEKSRQSLDEL